MSAFDPWYTKHQGPRVSKTYVDTWVGRRGMNRDVRGATSFGWEVVQQNLQPGHANVGSVVFYILIGLIFFWTIVVPLSMLIRMNRARTKSTYFIVFQKTVESPHSAVRSPAQSLSTSRPEPLAFP